MKVAGVKAAASTVGQNSAFDYEPPEDMQLPFSVDVMRRMFAYMRPYAGKRNWLIFLVLARAFQTPLLAWIVWHKVMAVAIPRGDWRSTAIWVGVFVAVELVTEYMFIFRNRFALQLGEAIVHDLRNDIQGHLMRMPLGFFQRTKVGRLISRMTSDVDLVRTGVQDVVFVSIVQLGSFVTGAFLMAYYDWELFLVVLLMAPLLWTLVRYFKTKLLVANQKVQETYSRVTAQLVESVNGIRVIQGFVRQDFNGGLFGQLIEDHSKNNMEVSRRAGTFQQLLEFNTQLFISILLVVGGYRALHGSMSIETLVTFMGIAGLMFGPIPVLGNQYNNLLTSMAGAQRVFHLLDTKPDWVDAPDAKVLPPIEGCVRFENVTFEYVPGHPVLHGIDFVAEPGQTVALVGHTGSGKSSIIKLVSKLHLPTSGRVTFDDHDVLAITAASLRAQMGSVPQDNFLFAGTVMENIRVGRRNATDAEVIRATTALDVRDLIEELPKGFETEVGEKGGNLSLGQRQIVCFARAMLANPRIIILDEATSSVDSVTEARLQTALSKLLAGRTSFVIAHRLSTIRHADMILVLDHGRIVERGTHVELCERDGVYAALYRQFIGGLGEPLGVSPLRESHSALV